MSLPRLPTSITVLGVEFRIELVPDLKSEGERVSGETVGEYHRIRIDAGLDIERQWQTLIHEHVHAILHVVGVGNFLDPAVEEVIAQSLEYGTAHLLMQYGPQLVRVIRPERGIPTSSTSEHKKKGKRK